MAGLPELETTHPAATARALEPELRTTTDHDALAGAPAVVEVDPLDDELEGLVEGFDLDEGALDDDGSDASGGEDEDHDDDA